MLNSQTSGSTVLQGSISTPTQQSANSLSNTLATSLSSNSLANFTILSSSVAAYYNDIVISNNPSTDTKSRI